MLVRFGLHRDGQHPASLDTTVGEITVRGAVVMGGDRVGPATPARWRRFAAPGGLVVWTLLGVCLVLARQVEYGVGLEFDSANYISAAHNLSSGQLLRYDGEIFSAHAPLYPALLVVAGFGVFDPLDVAGPLNAVLFGAMVWICGAFLRRRLASSVWAQCGCAAIAVSPPLVDAAATAMPTTGTALLTACVLICTAERDLRWRRVALTTMLSALACLMHYTSVALLAVASIALLLPIGGGGGALVSSSDGCERPCARRWVWHRSACGS